ncbi:MAG: bifunctional phosphopantothenoylcysteine decarboxylase/phosphopantothenate--cysteine ligase CoaBC [Rhodospirillales bacterium]|jgi:phosphopantothenoylcysteine decarboxylase / phosphopantothenate---cysteine ligase|nr:bifunctional phosphopantothenoylcysteine decarboxylase/phosphopantothenate--cysteine ligase CoaBC [Rhodospirillales bacterium]
MEFAVLTGKRILLVLSGGIAAYKCPDLVRRLRERGAAVRCVMTRAAEEFVTPLTLGAVSGNPVHRDMFSLTEENGIGHIQLSREADVLVVAPATANTLAKMANGLADDLASTILLATSAPIMVAPAMNVRMWNHEATQNNLKVLKSRGVTLIGPNEGDMACGEYGFGRMAEVDEIVTALAAFFEDGAPLSGQRALVTSGPTVEAIDPVRYIANRSSGKQGHAIAAALAGLGAQTTLVTGPTDQPDPPGVTVVHIESAVQMLTACKAALPADIAVCAAAVADWRAAETAANKIKKSNDDPPAIELARNPDILATLATDGPDRPRLVVGFAAETENVIENAVAKRAAKGCNWIVANDVSSDTGTFGGDDNSVHLVTGEGGNKDVEDWPRMSKRDVAARLAARIAEKLGGEL